MPINERDGSETTINLHIPMKFNRRGEAKEIVFTDLADYGKLLTPLQHALARSYRWQKMLDTGQVQTIRELAGVYSLNPASVTRILRLQMLAPDIVEAILNGNPPEGINMRKVRKKIPLSWQEQRKLYCGKNQVHKLT